jgi:hypothetical protein
VKEKFKLKARNAINKRIARPKVIIQIKEIYKITLKIP